MKQPADDRARRADLASWDLVLDLDLRVGAGSLVATLLRRDRNQFSFTPVLTSEGNEASGRTFLRTGRNASGPRDDAGRARSLGV